MRILSLEEVGARLGTSSGEEPRVVVSGNFATPTALVDALEASRARCRLFAINAQADWPRRSGLINETPFVGPGMRQDASLEYLPMRLSLVPRLFVTLRPVDAVLIHTSVPRDGKVSLGIEVNILPAAIENTRARWRARHFGPGVRTACRGGPRSRRPAVSAGGSSPIADISILGTPSPRLRPAPFTPGGRRSPTETTSLGAGSNVTVVTARVSHLHGDRTPTP